MKSSVTTTNNALFESENIKSNEMFFVTEQTFSIFNAGAGMFILFALFSIFILFAVFVLFFLALETNVLAVAAAIILSATAGLTVLIVSHAVEMNIELTDNGE